MRVKKEVKILDLKFITYLSKKIHLNSKIMSENYSTLCEIPGYTGYKVNRNDDVWSEKNKKFLKKKDSNGYLLVSASKIGSKTASAVHRLVALTFIPNPENKPYVNHMDCNKYNNRVDNLEWVTQNENTAHHQKKISHDKKVVQYSLDGIFIKIHNSVTEAGKSVNLSRHAINKVCIGQNQTAGGFKWEYEIPEDKSLPEDFDEAIEITYANKEKTYYVFPDGRIFNKSRKAFLNPVENISGYCYVTLVIKDGKKKNIYVHRIVADHFLRNDNPSLKTQVNHKNKIRSDNRMRNLEWVSPSENVLHAYKVGH